MASLNGSSNDHSRPLKRSRAARDEHSGNNVVLDNSSVVVRKMVWNNTNPPNAPSLDLNTNDSNALFEALIHPLSRHDFLSCYFRKCAVHTTSNTSTNNTIIDGNDTNRLEPLLEAMNHLDPARILQDTSSENIFVWLLHQNEIDDDENNDRSKRMIQSIEVDTVETAIALYKAGHATYCRTSPHVEQVLVRHVLRATGMGCGQYNAHNEQATLGRGEVEVFMTPNNHHTTDWHFDFQENFTLQLSGSKKWYLLKGVVDHPLRACTPHYAAPEAVESQLKAAHLSHPRFEFGKPKVGVNAQGSVEEVLMRPGDVLYHPAGIWHKVEVLEPGVSINISLMATNYATITCQALQHFLMKKMAWRETLVSNGSPDQVREQLGGLLQHVLLDDVQDFIAQCGASAIVPPVLSRAVDPDCLQTGGARVGQFAEADEQDECSMHDNDDETEATELIVDVSCFNENLVPFSNSKLRINPLASLLRMNEDVLEYYKTDETMDHVYVLNVNYAGNDMHESAVRVLLRDTKGHLDEYADVKRPLEWSYTPEDGRDLPPWRRCLIFYGFFLPC